MGKDVWGPTGLVGGSTVRLHVYQHCVIAEQHDAKAGESVHVMLWPTEGGRGHGAVFCNSGRYADLSDGFRAVCRMVILMPQDPTTWAVLAALLEDRRRPDAASDIVRAVGLSDESVAEARILALEPDVWLVNAGVGTDASGIVPLWGSNTEKPGGET